MTGSTPRDGRNGRPEGPAGLPSAVGNGSHDGSEEDHVPAATVFMDPATGRALRQSIANDNPPNLRGIKRWGLILGLLAIGGAISFFLVQ